MVAEVVTHRLLILRRAIPILLVPVQRLLDLLGELGFQLDLGFDPQRHGCGCREKNEVFQAGRVLDGEGGSEHASPRLAYDVVFLDLEGADEVLELVDEELDSPKVCVTHFLWEMGREAVADLVIDNEGARSSICRVRQDFKVLGGDSWPTVKAYEGTNSGTEGTDDFVVRFAHFGD